MLLEKCLGGRILTTQDQLMPRIRQQRRNVTFHHLHLDGHQEHGKHLRPFGRRIILATLARQKGK